MAASTNRPTPFRTGRGTRFWSVADQQGSRCKVLNVPFVFPADDLKNGHMLCGLGVTDLRGTTSTYTLLSDSFTPEQLKERVSGGMHTALPFDGEDTAVVKVPGPRDTRYKSRDPKAYTEAEIKISVDRDAGVGKAQMYGQTVEFVQGEWSEWCELQFPMSSQYTAYSVTRFFPLEIGTQVRIYMACQQFHPQHAYTPFTEPTDYAEELHDRYGLFKTIGWAYDTHALRQGGLDEDAFMADVEATMAWREKLDARRTRARRFRHADFSLDGDGPRRPYVLALPRPETPHVRPRGGGEVRQDAGAKLPDRGPNRPATSWPSWATTIC